MGTAIPTDSFFAVLVEVGAAGGLGAGQKPQVHMQDGSTYGSPHLKSAEVL